MFDLSFCIPTLDRASELAQSLHSIIDQADERVEIVIVDGGSTDGTAELVARLAATRFPSIRLLASATRSGVDRDVLQAVEAARGTHCWLFSDDDRLAPGALAAVRQRLAADPSLAGISTNYQAYDAAFTYPIATVPAFSSRPDAGDAVFTRREDCFSALALHLGFISCQVVDRQRWLAAVGQRDVTPFCNAWIIVYMIGAMLEPGARWLYLSEVCVHYRSGNDSFMARQGLWRRQLITHVAFADILRHFFAENSPPYRAVMATLIRDRMPRTLAVLKARGMPVGLQLSLLRLYVARYGSHPGFWWRVLPLFALPGAVYRGAWSLYRRRRIAATATTSTG